MTEAARVSIAAFLQSKRTEALLDGRIVDVRLQEGGKAIVLSDPSGFVELGVDVESVGRIGDYVRVRARKRTGTTSGHDVHLLARCRREINPESNWEKLMMGRLDWERFTRRTEALQTFRESFLRRGYLEVETPLIDLSPTLDPHIRSVPVELRVRGKPRRFYLQTSPEYYMKMLMVAGAEKIFQFARVVRDDEATALHNPEFTLLEWYRAGVDYRELISEIEELFCEVIVKVKKTTRIRYQGRAVDVRPPWDKLSLRDAFLRYAGIDLDESDTVAKLRKRLDPEEFPGLHWESWEDLFFRVLAAKVEPDLGIGKPTVVYDYPTRLGTMAAPKAGKPGWLERFEVYMAGVELGNGYTELTDAGLQARRFRASIRRGKRPQADLPETFLRALEYGMPPAAGVAFGFDRLLMILSDSPTIENVLYFPLSQFKGAGEVPDGKPVATRRTQGTKRNRPRAVEGR